MLDLCRSDTERRMGVFRAGAVPVLSTCLVSHPMSGEVAAACYGALSELARSDSESETVDHDIHSLDTLNVLLVAYEQYKVCKAAFDTGAHLKLMEARSDHPSCWSRTSAMCRLINYMCRRGAAVKTDLCIAGAVVALLDSLAKMGDDLVVCSCGMEALSCLSKMAQNRSAMRAMNVAQKADAVLALHSDDAENPLVAKMASIVAEVHEALDPQTEE
ncbi:hypothetical protein KIPB_011696 [Kipferlia bialata]|uniref:Armadillo-like helical n=1 Tax=Kipferlia bialata TaxID=797122 RepID=A0A9K3D554_9EUKA|nr:hypothetical protein KIPB_011696 [Kipferlia bialata]|eukprot:g11696.t1